MQTLAEIVLSNTAIAAGLALVASVVGRYCRLPSVMHVLWLLVLVKLATPPVIRIPVALWKHESSDGAEATTCMDVQRPTLPKGDSNTIAAIVPLHSDDSAVPQTGDEDNSLVLPTYGDTFSASANRPRDLDWASEPDDSAGNQPSDSQPNRSLPSGSSVSWSMLVICIWTLGSVVWFSAVLLRLLRFRCEMSRSWPVDAALQQRALELARHLGLRRLPVIKYINAAIPPMLTAMWRRAEILLPAPLIAALPAEQQSALLAHELAHYSRRDHWIRWLETFVVGVFWWHPVVWIARRQVHRAEEQCCDNLVLCTLPDGAIAYARAIMKTIDFLSGDCCPAPSLATGLGPVHQLERRIEMILQARPMHHGQMAAKWCPLLLGLLVLPLSAKGQVATEPAEPAVPAVATEPSVTPAAVPTVGATPPVAVPEVTGLPAPSIKYAEPTLQPAATSDIERRVQRLEKMVESLVAELRGERRPQGSGRSSLRSATREAPSTSAYYYGLRQDTSSLSELRKQRIDVEEQLENLQQRLQEIDDQIAKLQSARTQKQPSRIPEVK